MMASMHENNEEYNTVTTCLNIINRLELNDLIEVKKSLDLVLPEKLSKLERSAISGNDQYVGKN